MKKVLTILCIFFLSSTTGVFAEVIKSFDSQIVVNSENSVSVTETIVYDSEGEEKHGIYRDIRPISSDGKRMDIKSISVVYPSGTTYQWQKQSNSGDVRLKIGDPNATFQGQKTYIIRYVATGAIVHLENNLDEIYWNVTGNNWPFDIESTTATVVLPDGAILKQSSCYQGATGSTDTCIVEKSGINFKSTRRLLGREGMTVAVGFPSGVVYDHVPTAKEKFLAQLAKFWPLFIPLLTFVFMFQRWYRKGRDAKGGGIIIPEYEVMDNLTPLEAAVIIHQKFTARDLIAEILWFATKGCITITQTVEKKFLGKKTEFTLTLTKANTNELTSFDKQLLQEIFYLGVAGPLEEGKEVTLSQSYSLFGITGSLGDKLKKRLVENGYYTKDFITINSLQTKRAYATVFVLIFIGVFVLQTSIVNFLVSEIFPYTTELTAILLIPSIIVAAILASIFNTIMPAKTQKGMRTKEHLLGLKNYIKVAEKDRIAFHNAPEVNASLFEKLLPFAVMFGLEKKWAEAFEGLTVPPMSWYSSSGYNGITGTAFAPAVISDLSRGLSSSFFTAASSGGGSGGGGFSGGGGGGGGGGSW